MNQQDTCLLEAVMSMLKLKESDDSSIRFLTAGSKLTAAINIQVSSNNQPNLSNLFTFVKSDNGNYFGLSSLSLFLDYIGNEKYLVTQHEKLIHSVNWVRLLFSAQLSLLGNELNDYFLLKRQGSHQLYVRFDEKQQLEINHSVAICTQSITGSPFKPVFLCLKWNDDFELNDIRFSDNELNNILFKFEKSQQPKVILLLCKYRSKLEFFNRVNQLMDIHTQLDNESFDELMLAI